MKKLIQSAVSILLLCSAVCFTSFKPANHLAVANRVVANNKNITPLQTKVQPYCKFHYLNHEGRMVVMHTNQMHWTAKSLTFMFDGGERLIITFSNSVRIGHYNIESTRAKDPQVLFYASHSSPPVALMGVVMIYGLKPISGAFPHLNNNEADHISIMSGSFTF
ncbi:MAG: hypothetical protein ABIN91_06925 [Mucilaginibacter sp.]|uniref:hypothetical protein n=1 Tax=Mucilaginibacter sp. TaxID=1882438 RepID=UPI003264D0F1